MPKRNATAPPLPRPELMRFAAWLRAEMRARKLGNNALAQRLEVSTSAVSHYRRALRAPRRPAQELLAGFFKVDLSVVEALLPRDPDEPAAAPAAAAFLPDRLPPGWKDEVRAAVLEGMRAVQAEREPTPIRGRRGGPLLIPKIDGVRASANWASGAISEHVYWNPPPDAGDDLSERYVQIEVSGECLSPLIESGDDVVVDRKADRREGDIVVGWHENDLIVKRLAMIDGEAYLVANDVQMKYDHERTHIEGVAISVVRRIERGPLPPAKRRRT